MPSLTVTAVFSGFKGTKRGLLDMTCWACRLLEFESVLSKLLWVINSTPIARLPFSLVVLILSLVVDSNEFSS